jgi:glycosyltransferase involved in cell wall biosynthesis
MRRRRLDVISKTAAALADDHAVRAVGVWTEWPRGAGWTNEGMTRLLGFIIEGAAATRRYVVHVFVARHIRPEAAADLAQLRAAEGADYVVHSVEDDVPDAAELELLIEKANATPIDGWIVLYPYMHNATRLHSRVAVVLPDANPIRFPNFGDSAWDDEGPHVIWRRQVAKLAGSADRVITFSKHVADDEARCYFSIPRDRIAVVPHAPPNLLHLLPFVDPARKTAQSVSQAADILREHCGQRGWTSLANYPFEEISFFVVSTQDRTTKNLVRAAQGVSRILRDRRIDLKMITTAPIHLGAGWTEFPSTIQREALHHDVVSMSQLPREVHAALYHCAAFVVHPSIFEGGQGPFPFYEGVSVGTPCLIADGPHTRELLDSEPSLRPFVFEPYDADALARLMEAMIGDPEAAIVAQREAFERLSRTTWAEVASAYVHAALSS